MKLYSNFKDIKFLLVVVAAMIVASSLFVSNSFVNKLKLEKSNLELKITNLTDLAPDSKDSLRPCDANWNANTWVTDLQRAKQDLYNVTIQLEIAQKTYDEYFKEEVEMITD